MSLFTNLRYATRQLRKSPAFTVTVLGTLALCIGANTAVFTLVDTLFFRPLPYPEPQRLAALIMNEREGGASEVTTAQTGLEWELIRDHASTLESAVFAALGGVNLTAGKRVEYITDERVSANFFRVVGIKPLLGREFTVAEDVPGGPPLAILSFALWQRLFHQRPDVLGRTIELHGLPYTVVGVMPAGFVPPTHALTGEEAPVGVWTPLQPTTTGEGAGGNYRIIARLKPGVTFADANGQLNSILRGLFDQMKQAGVSHEEQAIPLQTGETNNLRLSVRLLWGAVAVVLLIGCVNIAGLMLARSALRSREVATRLALGATRQAVMGELLTECLVLALGGGALGILLGKFALDGLLGLNPGAFEIWGSITLDARVMAVMLAVSLITSVLFGLAPAFEATLVDLRSSLSEAGRASAGSRRQWKRQALVFAEVVLGVVLVVSAGLLIRTFATLVNANPGFDPHRLMVASASLQDPSYSTASQGARLFRESIARIEQIPGVESAAVALTPPYGRALNNCVLQINGVALTHSFCLVNFTYATPGMFQTLRMKLLRGSFFTDADIPGTAPVAVVNHSFVHHYLKDDPNPVGMHVRFGQQDWRIIGVTSDVPQKNTWGQGWGPLDAFPQVYIPAAQCPDNLFALANMWFSPVWMVRTRAEVPGLPDAVRRALAAVDPRLPLSSFRSVEAIAGRSLQAQRYRATLFSLLAGLGTLLAALGVYGLIAESVSQRTREIGIRLALGATSSGVIRAAAAPGILLSLSGIGAGLILALFATRLLKGLVWGVDTTDPATFIAVAVLLLAVAITSSVVPALRLAHIDPAQILRDE